MNSRRTVALMASAAVFYELGILLTEGFSESPLPYIVHYGTLVILTVLGWMVGASEGLFHTAVIGAVCGLIIWACGLALAVVLHQIGELQPLAFVWVGFVSATAAFLGAIAECWTRALRSR